jgi:ferredoxin
MPKVAFVNEKTEVEVPEGSNLREVARQAGIQMNYLPLDTSSGLLGRYLNCMGHGHCGSCRVFVKKGMENLAPKGWWERFRLATMLSSIGHEEEVRLACQVQVKGDCTVETHPLFNWSGDNFWQKPYPNK